LNSTLFPTAPNNTLVHDGFQKAFLSTAEDVKSTVLDGLQKYQSKKVLVTGHSLGAAIGVFDGVYLRGILGDEVSVTTHVFGLPRVGNSIWA
jgi:Lipase (class 3)